MSYTLRKYQMEAVAKGVEFFASDKKDGAIIVAPTGSGKSCIIASICHALNGNVLILQPSLEVLISNKEKAEALGITDIGVFSASAGRKDIGQITFATVKSLINKKELLENFEYCIIDECHQCSAKQGQYKEVIKYFQGKVLGLTATPFRLHSFSDQYGNRSVVAKFLTRTRPKLFHKIIHITQIGELYNQGFLCPIEYITNSDFKHSEIKLNSTGVDFDLEALERYNEQKGIINKCVYAIRHGVGKHVLVFLASVQEAQELSVKLNDIGIVSASVTAKTPKKDRTDILEKFKNGDIKVVTNVGTMTCGYDFPALDTVILSRPTQSVALHAQMIGRCMRVHPSKKVARVIDLCGNVSRFGKIETFEIVEVKPGLHRLKSDKSFLSGVDFISGKDMEAENYKGLKESRWNEHAVIMSFGKYKGYHISKLPTDYLRWMEKTFKEGVWKEKMTAELKRRSDYQAKKREQEVLPF
jgi:DNA repair protein RadD